MRKFLIICFLGLNSSIALFSCGLHDIANLSISEEKMVDALQQALVLGSKTAAFNLGDSSCASSLASAGECTKGYLGNKLVEIMVPDTVQNVLAQINSFGERLNSLPAPIVSALDVAMNNFAMSNSFAFKPAMGETDLDAESMPHVSAGLSFFSNLSGYADKLKTALNRGAEEAAPASVDVFKGAIFGMSFSDARGILLGDSDTAAATSYLRRETYTGLKTAFGPIIKRPLDLLNPNQYWKPIASNYKSFATAYSNAISSSALTSTINAYNLSQSSANKFNASSFPGLPYAADALPQDLSGYLSTYATGKALDGLFLMVGRQESSLRKDPWGTVSALGGFITDTIGDLLGDVFSKAKDNLL